MFEGSYVALITPMTALGGLDIKALKKLVEWQVEQGTNGLVPVGTTGESPVLSTEEQCQVIETVVQTANGQIPVIAGCGSNNTVEAMFFHEHALSVGADAALHVTGYYNKPRPEGVFRHFEAISQLNSLPIIVYNVPHRTVIDISPETLARLATLPNVVGIKDATADLSRPIAERKLINKPFVYLSGEDTTAVEYNIAGGMGCISVTANVAPAQCAQLQRACLDGDFEQADKIQAELMSLHKALFVEPSPAGVKYACSRLGLCEASVRLPMVPLESVTCAAIDMAMSQL